MPEPSWMRLAWPDLGQRERAGATTNPRIARYFRDVGHAGVGDDETAWCAAFVGSVLERAGHPSTRSLMARSYLRWGTAAELPAPGAIAVLSRGSDPALGHVGFLVALTPETVVLLGGNQSNAVTVEAFDRRRLVGLRLPSPDASAARDAPSGEVPDAAPDAAFEEALALVLAHEGGWSDDPFDPGGPTNRGIALATYARERGIEVTAESIGALKSELRRIPDALVRRIYRERYWRPARCPDLPAPLAVFHFDAAVNQGAGTAARLLQETLGVDIDGDIGPVTLAAAHAADPVAALRRYADIRRRRYRALAHFWRFGRGWLARVDRSLAHAARLAGSAPAAAPRQTPPPSSPEPKEKKTMPDQPVIPNRSEPAPQGGSGPAPIPPPKWWGESLTIWGALLTAVTTVAPAIFAAFGIDIPADLLRQLGRDAVIAAQAIGGLIGTVMTIMGRVRAQSRLELRRLSIRL